ncbi:copper chaperone PCu(A)C [Bacillus subtilis subsp. subtilis]|nr:copper chaperone PCu(A)C [Bacillus subtilis subsp. subtilis]
MTRWATHLGLAVVLWCGPGGSAVLAAPRAPTAVVASEAWIRLPPPAADVAAGYVELHNGGPPDRLLAAHAAGFGQVQIHAMRMDGEVMRMQPLPDGLALPAGKITALRPGGYHLMLMMPKRPLQEGQHVRVRLQLASGSEQSVDFVVRDGMGGPAHGPGAGR